MVLVMVWEIHLGYGSETALGHRKKKNIGFAEEAEPSKGPCLHVPCLPGCIV